MPDSTAGSSHIRVWRENESDSEICQEKLPREQISSLTEMAVTLSELVCLHEHHHTSRDPRDVHNQENC